MADPIYQRLKLSKEEFASQLQSHFDLDQSLPAIAKVFGTNATTIHNWSKRLGVERARAATLRNKNWLFQKYTVEKMNQAEIATLAGVTYQAVGWWLNKHQIPLRPNTEIQQLANIKRPRSTFHDHRSFKSRGYCGWYKDIFYYRSINEVVWYMMNEERYSSIIYEPFIIENYKPDFLVDYQVVIEVKGTPTKQINEEYSTRSKSIVAAGYEYKIVYVQSEFPKEYGLVRTYLRKNGAIPGYGFPLQKNLICRSTPFK